ncbi:MAG: HAMP domain-containing sensor histidine kinase, partial [Clostridiales bacterium]
EQERLAFLGQMMGGLAHNLKTPIMSISGCISASGALLDECLSSIDDPQVVADDYREIYGEMESWFEKIKESCSYMSDIITAVKGQAANTGLSQESSFTLDELIKRSRLLMRHELLRGGCNLVTEYDSRQNIVIRGDINNLIQVINNLLSNAIDAQKMSGGGDIIIGVNKDQDHVKIYVKDTGPGVSESVKKKLFKEMTTSKGTMGTGLGLYISNIVVSGKFGGSLYLEDNPGGGSVFCISLPLEMVDIVDSSGNTILTQVGDII